MTGVQGQGASHSVPEDRPREPTPPAAVLGWVRRYGGTGTAPDTALEGGMRALQSALTTSAPGERESAWALLAADALLTWAVEDAADAPDPGVALEALMRRVQQATPS